MLRCAFLRRAPRNPRHHYQQGLQYRQSEYWPQVHPARWLGFLPLATNDEIAGKDPASNIGDKTGNVTDPGQSNGSDTTLRLAKLDVNSTSSFSTISPTTTQSCTETQEPETEHFDGGRRRDRTFFSASLFDGTIMFLWDGLIDLNGFKDLVMIVDGLWRKDSRDMSSRLPAQNIGLGIREGKFRDGFLSVNVWDIGVGTGTRPRLIYELIVPDEPSPCRANAWVLRCFIPDTKTYSWRKGTGAGLFRALKNYVGAVDHASSLNLFDPSIIHPLAHKMERFEQQFGLRECTTRPPNPMSFDLATHTIVSPSSVMVMTLEGFLTKATVLWQWWQRIDSHSLLAPDNSDAMTFVQIRQVDTSNDSFLVDVWRMSFAPDKSLSKSVHKILVSNDDSFKKSQVEMSEVMFNVRSKQDQPLREYLKSCLKNHVGFMDGAGNVVQQSQSKTHPLLLKLNRHKDFSSRMLPPKEARHTKTRAKSESDNFQLVTDTTKSKNYADVVSMNEEQIQPPLSKRGPEIADTPATLEEDPSTHVSATLYDGTLVVPSSALCFGMSQGKTLSFDNFLRIISQWWPRARDNMVPELRSKPYLVYIRGRSAVSFFQIKLFSRDDQWCDQTIINYELHHSQHTSDYSFVSHEILDIQIMGTKKFSREWKTIRRPLSYFLENYIGTVDETGILRKGDKPKVLSCFGKTWGPTDIKAKASSAHQDNDDELLLSQVEQKPAGDLSKKTEDFVDSNPPEPSRKQTSLSNVKPRTVASNPDSSKDSRKDPATKEKSWVLRSIFAENPKYKPTKASHVASSLRSKPTPRADVRDKRQRKHYKHRSESGGNDGDDGDDGFSLFAL
ncbi:hypothetical protein D6C87_08987 [Aureobasidium pullulans]|uniref:DUF3074 domain-containing protein n=1 Tax=Aureobasidium pullulans TaxID=5580 RepID=A0AB38MBU3_AURPU|nr:hypothetical protein D6C94_00348 [Aureobasidium pullulans]THZ25227.1 hypothetical protein D6C89_04472 [Aureobasidium pullulans]THZ36710.1 hypothetical protein D6C87_08987 [Aureobasidium pullulans]